MRPSPELPVRPRRLGLRFVRRALRWVWLAWVPLAMSAPPPSPPPYSISDAVKDVSPPKDLPERSTSATPVITETATSPEATPGAATIDVREIRVEGAGILDPDDIEPVIRPYRGRALTLAQMNELANRLTVLARRQGYLVARAYVPKQAMRDGILLIQLVPGRYGRFHVRNGSSVRTGLVEGLLQSAGSGATVVTRESLERAMFLVGDLPGARLPQVLIAPGAQPGTADFTVTLGGSQALEGYAIVDNYGSRFTGKERVTAAIAVDEPLHVGDKLSLSGLSTSAAGLQNARAAYDFPLNERGLRAELAISKTTYKLGGEYANLDASGVADAVEATVTYPFRRTRTDNILFSATLADRFLQDRIAVPALVTDKRARVALFSLERQLSGQLFGRSGNLDVTGSLTFGRLTFADLAQREANELGADTVGNYRKLALAYRGRLDLSAHWSLGTSLLAQYSLDRNLDGSEQISVSGVTGIKAYPDGVTNDNGGLLGVNLQYALPPLGRWLQTLGPFADEGVAGPAHGAYTSVHTVHISDVGLGYELGVGGGFAQLQLARTTGSAPATASYNHQWKFLAELGVRF